MRYLTVVSLLLLLNLGISNDGFAGIAAVHTTTNEVSGQTLTEKIFIDGDHLRFESVEDQAIFIFDAAKEVVWSINLKDKTYTEMTKADIEAVGEQVNAAMTEQQRLMEEQLKQLPPEQRQMMEDMMGVYMPDEKPPVVYKKIRSGEKIGTWVCDVYDGYEDDTKIETVWAADETKLGITGHDFATLQKMADFFAKLNPDRDEIYAYGSAEAEEKLMYSGVPVKTVTYEGDHVVETSELRQIEETNVDAALFKLPEGLKKVDWREQMQHN